MRKPKNTKEELMKEAFDLVMREETEQAQNRKSDTLLGFKIGYRACEAKIKKQLEAKGA